MKLDRDARRTQALYDSQFMKFSFEQQKYPENRRVRNLIYRLIANPEGQRILFAGCGDGTECRQAIRKGGIVTGIDVSGKCLELARKNCNGAEFKLMDMEKTGFKKSSFDIVIANFSLMYKKNICSVLREFNRMLKKEGFVVFSVPHPVRKMIKYNRMSYFVKGLKNEIWNGVRRFNYYRLFEDYIDAIVNAKFKISRLIEPKPDETNYPHHAIFKIVKEIK